MISSTNEAVGYTSTTFPTIPSGVITAIPFCTPLVDAAIDESRLSRPTPVALPIMCAATVFDGEWF